MGSECGVHDERDDVGLGESGAPQQAGWHERIVRAQGPDDEA